MKQITKHLETYQTPKTKLAAKIGIPVYWLYVWLNPPTYGRKTFPARYLMSIAQFERMSFQRAREDYLARLNRETAAA